MPELTPQSDQQHVFVKSSDGKTGLPLWQVGENWVDLYAILGITGNATTSEIENAILNRGANFLSFAFTRGAKPELAQLIEGYIHDFRPILLNPENRRRYDALLLKHRQGESGAMSYEEFRDSLRGGEQAQPAGCLNMVILAIGLAQIVYRVRFC